MTGFTGAYRSIVAFLLVVTVAHAAPIDPKNPPEGLFSDEWAEIHMTGGKVGYMHSTMTRDGNIIRTAATMKMKVGRAAQNVTIKTKATTTESLDGTALGFTSDMDASVMKTSMRGTMADGKVKIVTAQFGMEQTQTFDFAPKALMTWGLYRQSMLRGYEPGTSYTLQAFSPDLRLDGPVDAITKVGNWETFQHAGKDRKGQRVSVTMKSPVGAMEMISWVDADARMLKGMVPAPGLGDLEIIATDEATALGDFAPPEMFMTTVVRAGRTLEPKAIRSITYRIRSKQADVGLDDLPSRGMQRVVKRNGDTVVLVVERQSHAPQPAHGRSGGPSPEPSMHEHTAMVAGNHVGATHAGAGHAHGARTSAPAEFLGSNLMINTSDPELIALAKRAAASETEPFALGDRLRRFVTDYITTKSLNIGFATASEVCRTKEGDCSEHGVLLAALGRINGLPSRVAVGLAYVRQFGGQKDIFGYHMWTQFFIDGRWIDFDAALRESDCSPTRIAFATSSLKNTGLADLTLPLISKIGAIDLSITKVEPMANPKD